MALMLFSEIGACGPGGVHDLAYDLEVGRKNETSG